MSGESYNPIQDGKDGEVFLVVGDAILMAFREAVR
jgi:hypothetical protein